ncbi:hypothetical protein Tco_0461985 [Tanacetum coccineum]
MGRRWSGGAVVDRGEVVLVVCGLVGVVREGGYGVELAAMAAMAWMMMIKMAMDGDEGDEMMVRWRLWRRWSPWWQRAAEMVVRLW